MSLWNSNAQPPPAVPGGHRTSQSPPTDTCSSSSQRTARRIGAASAGIPVRRRARTASAVSHTGDMQACSRHPSPSSRAKPRSPRSPRRITGWSSAIPSRWSAISEDTQGGREAPPPPPPPPPAARHHLEGERDQRVPPGRLDPPPAAVRLLPVADPTDEPAPRRRPTRLDPQTVIPLEQVIRPREGPVSVNLAQP